MLLKFELSHLFLFVLSLYPNWIFTLNVPPEHVAGKEGSKPPIVNTDHVEAFSVSKKSDHILEIPVNKLTNIMDQPSTSKNKEESRLVLEGGGIVDLTTPQPSYDQMDTEMVDDGTNHSKGSKPRKGVQHQGSSVVPRKGVDSLGAFSLNQSSAGVTSDPMKVSTNTIIDSHIPVNKTEPLKIKPDQLHIDEKATPKVTHPKKPVVVTDIEDVDDFEKYPIIQTSTTGEDYIIIGIVIVLGIWCSIFGALIFYRRAGEYWDRRHYRRMDFLVEGMYND